MPRPRHRGVLDSKASYRTARVGQLIRRILAESVARIDDPRLGWVSVTGVDVDNDLNRAVVWFTSLGEDAAASAALEDNAPRLRRDVASRSRLRKTPELLFRPDAAQRAAERVEQLIAAANSPADPGRRDGIVVIDKPTGWTSHDVVAKTRGVLATRRVGHSGTLDPDATGVLVLGVGRATRLLRFVTPLHKSYEAEMVLGVETDTLDASGEVTARHDMAGVTDARVRSAAAALTGRIMQRPPMVSAVKIGGTRLHRLARAGIEVERPARPVKVTRFDVEPVEGAPGVWRARVDCSSGTYVRALAADLGRSLGGGAHLRRLRRTAVGHFTLMDARPVESPRLLPMASAVHGLHGVQVEADVEAKVRNGRPLPLTCLGVAAHGEGLQDSGPDAGPWAVHNTEGELLAVYERHHAPNAKPVVVVAGGGSR